VNLPVCRPSGRNGAGAVFVAARIVELIGIVEW